MTRLARAAQHLHDGRLEVAAEDYRAVLSDDPGNLEAFRGLAYACWRLGRRDDAVAVWQQVHDLDSEHVEALFELGNACLRRADHDGALARYRQALAIKPDAVKARGMLLLAMLYAGEADDEALWREQTRWGEEQAPPADALPLTHANDPNPERPLTIGYVSSDFCSHPTGMSMIPVYAFHDRSAFRVISYSFAPTPDAGTEELRKHSDLWRDVAAESDAELAQMVRDDGVDILVVLSGHLDNNRPFVCRYRPSPVQISHHDPLSTGIPEIDYMIGDFTITPAGTAERFSERVLRLPCWTVHPITAETPEVEPLPALKNGYVTFGSFNNPSKINSSVIDLWCEVLDEVPDSRLILKHLNSYQERGVKDQIVNAFLNRGLASERLEVVDDLHLRSEHLVHYGKVDIALDPFPFNGATTTFEAMLMGVPVISLRGERLAGRYAASLLYSVRMDLCVAKIRKSYVDRAVELASDLDRLAQLRAALPELVRSSRLFDARRYTRNLERYYRAVWRRWCAEQGAKP